MTDIRLSRRYGFTHLRRAALAGLIALALPTIPAAQEQATDAAAQDLRNQANALVYASNVVTDETRQGIAQLEQLAEAGNRDALLDLGGLHLWDTLLPRDWDKSLSYMRRAADAGDYSGIYQYGMMLMWAEKDWRQAQSLLTEAGEKGVTAAWTTLAAGAMYGYLGGGRHSRAKYQAYADLARENGADDIAVLEAARYQWGISVDASGPQSLATLETAADAGNKAAATALIRLQRDGNGLNVRRRPAEAEATLERYSALFSEAETWQLGVSIRAAMARGAAAALSVSDEVLAHPELSTKGFGADLNAASPKVAMMVLQAKLARAGYEPGAADGFAGRRTLGAMYRACTALLTPATCADSVMRPDVIGGLLDRL